MLKITIPLLCVLLVGGSIFIGPVATIAAISAGGVDVAILYLLLKTKVKRHPNMLRFSNYVKSWKKLFKEGPIGLAGQAIYHITGRKSFGFLADALVFIFSVNYLVFPGMFWR